MVGMIEKIINKLGYFRTKAFSELWAMAQEARLFGGKVSREYEQVATVYKSIKAISDNASQVKLKFYRVSDDEEVNDPDLDRLFKRPNPLMSWGELLEGTVIYHRLHGEAFWVFEQSVGQVLGTRRLPSEIWTFAPTAFKEIVNRETKRLEGWRMNEQTYGIGEVLHLNDFNPYNIHRGLAPMKPGRTLIDINWFQLIHNRAFFENDATPSFALSTEQSMSEKQRERVFEWLKKRHQGASNAFKAAVFEAGLKPVSISHSAKDMDYVGQRQQNREELIGIWRVPKAILSISESLNYATFAGQKKIFWTDTIVPMLKRLEDEINAQFFLNFMPEVYCKFDFSNIPELQEDLKEKMLVAKDLFAMGVPFNVINEKLDLGIDDIEGGDTGYLPFSLMPVSMAGANALPAPASDDGKEKTITAEASEIIWKGFLRRHDPVERKIQQTVSSHLYQQRTRVLSSLGQKMVAMAGGKGPDDPVFSFAFDWGNEAGIFAEKMRPNLLTAVSHGAEFARNVAGGTVDQAVLDGKLKSYLQVQVDQLQRITDFQRVKIEGIIQAGIQQGETASTIAANIRSFYNSFTPMAALRIARTETTRAINGGSLQYYEAVGAKTKTWITARDENVRDSHVALHNRSVNIGERFDNGLMYPGDDGDPGEVVNCRCTMITREKFDN